MQKSRERGQRYEIPVRIERGDRDNDAWEELRSFVQTTDEIAATNADGQRLWVNVRLEESIDKSALEGCFRSVPAPRG